MLTRLRLNSPLPSLGGVTTWLDRPATNASLAGRPVLIYFWSAHCTISRATLPTIAEWRLRYRYHDIQFIGIHVPRDAEDTQPQRVRAAAEAYQVVDACGLDNQYQVKAAFATATVPAFFFFDRFGKLRSRAGGPHGLALLEQTLQRYTALNP
jgi:thiol-disulfide isomerase/thioredoxin